MKKILIVMESSDQMQQLERQLSGVHYAISCDASMTAVEMIREYEPDVLVLDLMLSQMDGISLLEHTWNGGFRPIVIAMTPYFSDYIISALERMDVSCLLRSPCETNQLVARILDVITSREENAGARKSAIHILASLGFKMNTSGFRITQLALEIYSAQPKQKITAELYPAVAVACDGTATQVEKAIRDSIESAWKESNDQVWKMYFPAGKNGKSVKPTNGDFIARISRCLTGAASDEMLKKKIG